MKYAESRLTHVSNQLRKANSEFDALTTELSIALDLLRQLQKAIKVENVLTEGKYAGLALGVSALLERFPASGETNGY